MQGKRIFLGMPTYGQQTSRAGCGFWRACADMSGVMNAVQEGSLLAANFNTLWCTALNIVNQGGQVDYFAMLHDDIGPLQVGPDQYWLDNLIAELEEKQLDVLGVAVPIKDTRGMTSLALHEPGDNWMPHCRLTMRDIFELPETFTSEDLGHPLLLNTGCWVCKFDIEWAKKVHFTINDRIVYNEACGRYQSQTEPEDWYFSRLLHEQGLRIGATRKIPVTHRGNQDFQNLEPWGSKCFDSEAVERSPVPGAFPYEIDGWLTPAEGKSLAEAAKGNRVLEIGSYCGRSTVCLARTAKHVTAVDYFDGRGTPAPRDTMQEFRSNLRRYGITDKVCICHPEATVPLPKYDLLFIDGAHDHESVESDIEKYLPYLAEDGLIAFHDYNEPYHPGVTESVDKLLAAGGRLVSVKDTLALVKPPALVNLEA